MAPFSSSLWKGHDFIMNQQPTEWGIQQNTAWYYFAGNKKGLDIARWDVKAPESSTPRYEIISTFTEKMLRKGSFNSTWHPGINLMTGLHLGFYYLKHNDLVIGNFIMTGKTIVPIDFNDPRRNIDSRVCVHAAVALLKEDPIFTATDQQLERYSKKLFSRWQRFKAKLIKP